MPSRPPRVCRCGKVVPAGSRCACQNKRHAEAKARHDAARPTASERGYGGKWQREREAYLAIHRTCVRCGAPSSIVNHVQPHRFSAAKTEAEKAEARRLFWSRSNWEAVCTPCHNGPIQSAERRSPRRQAAFDRNRSLSGGLAAPKAATPGVSSNFQVKLLTGRPSTARDFPETEFTIDWGNFTNADD